MRKDAFEGAVVVVTGAGAGIGRAAARVFSALGADLVIVDNRNDRLEALEADLRKDGRKPLSVAADVSDRSAMEDLAAAVAGARGRVDVLVNNAGIGLFSEIKDTRSEDWERIVAVNYWGVVNGIRAFLPAMIERGSGHIVNVASANGLFAFPFGGVYASTKFAVVGLSESLRAEVSRFGIGVTVVCPGLIRTKILDDALVRAGSDSAGRLFEGFRAFLAKRGADPEVVARALPGAIRRNRALVVVPRHVAPIEAVHRLAPWLYRWAIEQVASRKG